MLAIVDGCESAHFWQPGLGRGITPEISIAELGAFVGGLGPWRGLGIPMVEKFAWVDFENEHVKVAGRGTDIVPFPEGAWIGRRCAARSLRFDLCALRTPSTIPKGWDLVPHSVLEGWIWSWVGLHTSYMYIPVLHMHACHAKQTS